MRLRCTHGAQASLLARFPSPSRHHHPLPQRTQLVPAVILHFIRLLSLPFFRSFPTSGTEVLHPVPSPCQVPGRRLGRLGRLTCSSHRGLCLSCPEATGESTCLEGGSFILLLFSCVWVKCVGRERADFRECFGAAHRQWVLQRRHMALTLDAVDRPVLCPGYPAASLYLPHYCFMNISYVLCQDCSF